MAQERENLLRPLRITPQTKPEDLMLEDFADSPEFRPGFRKSPFKHDDQYSDGSVSEYSDEDKPQPDSQSHGEHSLHEEEPQGLVLPPSEYNRARAALMSCSVVSDPSEYRFNMGTGAPWVARSTRGIMNDPVGASAVTGSQSVYLVPPRGAQTLGFAGMTSVSTLDHRARPLAAKYASSELIDKDQHANKERRIANHNWSAQLSYQMSLGGSGRFDQVSQNYGFESRGKLDEPMDAGDDDGDDRVPNDSIKPAYTSKFRSYNFQNDHVRASNIPDTHNKKYPSWYASAGGASPNHAAPTSSFGALRNSPQHQNYNFGPSKKDEPASSRFKSAKFGSAAFNHMCTDQDGFEHDIYRAQITPKKRVDPMITNSSPSFRESGYLGALPPSVAEGSVEDRSMGTSNSQSKGAASGSTGKRAQTVLTAQEVQKLQAELVRLDPNDFEEAEKIIPRLESRMHIFLIDQKGTELLKQILSSSRFRYLRQLIPGAIRTQKSERSSGDAHSQQDSLEVPEISRTNSNRYALSRSVKMDTSRMCSKNSTSFCLRNASTPCSTIHFMYAATSTDTCSAFDFCLFFVKTSQFLEKQQQLSYQSA